MEEQRESTRAKKSHWKYWLAALLMIGLLIFGVSGYSFLTKNNQHMTPLPFSLVQSVDFPVYYPKKLPQGFYYKQGSANIDQGIFFYSITNGDAVINVSQQSKPSSFDFEAFVSTIKDFKPSESSVGKAYSGVNGSSPVTMVVDKESFISITGTIDTSSASIGVIAKSLH